MGAAISLFVLMNLSVFVVRIATVALRHTGLEESAAKFQAVSAISGTGFTTKEAESIVNYPVRRRIVMMLMVISNLGVVTVMATVVVSFVNAGGNARAIAIQIAWLLGVLGLLWFLILSKRADQWICDVIGKVLVSTTLLGKRHFIRLLQISDGYSVCQHPVATAWLDDDQALTKSDFEQLALTVFSTHTSTGDHNDGFVTTTSLATGDSLIVYGPDAGHDALEAMSLQSELDSERTIHRHTLALGSVSHFILESNDDH